METKTPNNHIQYVEFQATDFDATKKFYGEVFGWTFTDWGPEYISFENAGVEGGFALEKKVETGGPLVILYHEDLEQAKENVIKGDGELTKDIFSFPGGRRFEFTDPSGNKLAVWSSE